MDAGGVRRRGDVMAVSGVARWDEVAGRRVAVAAVKERVIARGDTDRRQRDLAKAAGSRITGLNHVVVASGKLSCPPHVHSAEEEIFVILEGEGTLLLYD